MNVSTPSSAAWRSPPPAPTGHDADPAALGRSSRQQKRRAAQGCSEPGLRLGAPDSLLGLHSDRGPFLEVERPETAEPQGFGEEDIVAESRMGIQRQMSAIDGQIAVEQSFEQKILRARPRMGGSPEKAVMDDQQIGPGTDGFADRRERGIDRGGDSGTLPPFST